MTETFISDGRAAIRIGNRRRMLLAGLHFIEKGVYRPTPLEIAKRAKMHRRSFFEIFGNIEGYMRELLDEHEASVQAAITKDFNENGKSLARLVLLGH